MFPADVGSVHLTEADMRKATNGLTYLMTVNADTLLFAAAIAASLISARFIAGI